ncbi:MAG: hypothetical protein VKO21_10340 [Candidatus Sericytochromatia bacterium]|nr:hypothetical protein [Candidatus Sericytochromatia bacterium]
MTRARKSPGSAAGEPDEGAGSAGENAEFNQRATFYFSEDQLTKLDIIMLELRIGKNGFKDKKIGKSELMRAALDMLIEDYNTRGADCWLIQRRKAEGVGT